MAKARVLILSALCMIGSLSRHTPAQQSGVVRPVVLYWPSLRLIISPDSEGTWVWASTREAGEPGKNGFTGSFMPAELSRWIPQAREFLRLQLADTDTGASRASIGVRTVEGGRMHLSRDRRRGRWTPEQSIVLQQQDTVRPFSILATPEIISEVLDSLESFNKRTPFAGALTDSGRKVDRHARGARNNRPPAYPPALRTRNIEGTVLVTFFVTAEGKADTSSILVVSSPHSDFTKEVLHQLPRLRFDPAMRGGKPVRERVVMPFNFALYRGPGRPR
jgi:TonB family protein